MSILMIDRELCFRRASAADAALGLDIKRAAMSIFPETALEWNEAEQLEKVTKRFSTNSIHFIEKNGQVIGTLGMIDEPDNHHISTFFILPDFRGQGVGAKALTCLMGTASVPKPFRLSTRSFQHSSISFYEKMGFRRVGIEGRNKLILERPFRQ